MADKRFLYHISRLRNDFKPLSAPINFLMVKGLEDALRDIGICVGHPSMEWYTEQIPKQLDFITRRSINMLAPDNYKELLDRIVDLHTRKNAGYAGIGTPDAWANFRTARWFGVSAFKGCLVRMGDKVIRVRHLAQNPACDQVAESIKDTLYDLAIYSIIALCLYEEELLEAAQVSDVRKEQA